MTILDPYKFKHLGLGVYLIDTQAFEDYRGYFMEGYNKDVFAKNGINATFEQYNVSLSKKGTLRGLHYQKEPYGQAKMFRCVQGEIFDACVDVRRGSKTFGQCVTATYSAKDKKMMFVPKGFANSILTTSEEDAIVVYMVEGYHVSEAETGLRWDDPDLAINWPVKPTLLSKKDQSWPLLKDIG
jgi:dTDP-4-dehydrorhamnose 3,5-epimerase